MSVSTRVNACEYRKVVRRRRVNVYAKLGRLGLNKIDAKFVASARDVIPISFGTND